MNATIDNRDSRSCNIAKPSDIRNNRPEIPRKAKRIMPSWAADRLFRPPIQTALKAESRRQYSISKLRTPGIAQSTHQKDPNCMKSKRHKVTDVCNQPVEAGRRVIHDHLHQFREASPSEDIETVIFSGPEHIRVQQEIERRAHELWCAGGCRDGTALNDWLHAEGEVMEKFIMAYAWRHSLP
jgi:hypothetical protein